MKNIITTFIICIIVGHFTGCATSIHHAVPGDISNYKKAKKGKKIRVEVKKQYIIGKFDNNFVDQAYNKLVRKCPKGKITGVSSTYMTDLGFYFFKEQNDIRGLLPQLRSETI